MHRRNNRLGSVFSFNWPYQFPDITAAHGSTVSIYNSRVVHMEGNLSQSYKLEDYCQLYLNTLRVETE